MNNIIGLREFRENLGKYERRIRDGQSFIIMKRSRPVFTACPVDDEKWETVIDFTQFRKGGITAQELLAKLKKM
jgi:antitoxin (DNA-binding transcriptional repressor) of toxin-antitoxin stability system